jgi:hypothetical protein
MRQPQASISPAVSVVCSTVTSAAPTTKPASVPTGRNPASIPRLWSGECSAM